MNLAKRQTRIQTYRDFWPFYLAEHAHPMNRRLHFVGTSLALGFLAAAVIQEEPILLVGAALSGYGLAWIGHFLVERNRPATFQYPIWSLVSDWRMWRLMVLRRPLK